MMFGIERLCELCGGKIERDPRYSRKQWESRKYCGHNCFFKEITYSLEQVKVSFEQRYTIDILTGCWEWTGGKCEKGYGMFTLSQRSIRAHRAAWFIYKGEKIPDHLQGCHKCDNPSCVNPDHIFLGTAKDNSDDKVAKNRANNLRGEDISKLTSIQVMEAYESTETAHKVAEAFGVCPSTIRNIRRRVTWSHLTGAK